MKKMLSMVVSGAVIAACAGIVVAAEPTLGTEMMKKIDEQQQKITSKEEKVKEAVPNSEMIKKADEQQQKITSKKEKAKAAIQKKEKAVGKAKEGAKMKVKKVKEIKEGKEAPMEKMTKATNEGEKSMQEMKDMKKEFK